MCSNVDVKTLIPFLKNLGEYLNVLSTGHKNTSHKGKY